jgi:hypothetical protein
MRGFMERINEPIVAEHGAHTRSFTIPRCGRRRTLANSPLYREVNTTAVAALPSTDLLISPDRLTS